MAISSTPITRAMVRRAVINLLRETKADPRSIKITAGQKQYIMEGPIRAPDVKETRPKHGSLPLGRRLRRLACGGVHNLAGRDPSVNVRDRLPSLLFHRSPSHRSEEITMDSITAKTGNAPIKQLGQTKGQSFGTNSKTAKFDNGVTDEDNGKASR